MQMFALSLQVVATLLLCAITLSRMKQMSLVRGTHAHYIVTTWLITFTSLVIMCATGAAVVYLGIGMIAVSVLNFLLATAGGVLLMRSLKDDNWFSNSWKKLKKKIKSIRIRLPRLRPVSAFN